MSQPASLPRPDIDAAVRRLRTTDAVRDGCRMIYDAALRGELRHFTFHPDRLDAAARYVADVIRDCYPTLDIPYHSRWRHFDFSASDRWSGVADKIGPLGSIERARAAVDLGIVSVLLDAGAGDRWKYVERGTGTMLSRSEGLAVASLHMFHAGLFSADKRDPHRADAAALATLSDRNLELGFQVQRDNPLVGLTARAELLRRLGRAIAGRPELFGKPARLGNLIDTLKERGGAVSAPALLALLLDAFAAIWPAGMDFHGVNIGDVGRHPLARADDFTNALVPFHKLSQWMTYSLIEPLEWAGLRVTDLDGLTGLPEYRNGGLFIDTGVLEPKALPAGPLDPREEPVVEWRAMTVILLDEIAARVRKLLGKTAAELPLAKVLQGGTWTAGRRIAAEKRAGGLPPILVATDGTTF